MDAVNRIKVRDAWCPVGSIFQQPWWLSIVGRGRIREITVSRNLVVRARMPVYTRHHFGMTICDMPPFTRTLGPTFIGGDAGCGPDRGLLSELISQLPPVHAFRQVLHPQMPDGLAFQLHNFRLGAQYTLRIDCSDLFTTWRSLRDKTRNVIRRARERYTMEQGIEEDNFVRFYNDNLIRRGEVNNEEFDLFPALFKACTNYGCGLITGAFDAGGRPVAMTFMIWDEEAVYYLLSTRAATADNGAVSLLLWHGLEEAHRRGRVFDFDGVSSPGRARFLSGFGGVMLPRIVVHKVHPFYQLLRASRDCFRNSAATNDYD